MEFMDLSSSPLCYIGTCNLSVGGHSGRIDGWRDKEGDRGGERKPGQGVLSLFKLLLFSRFFRVDESACASLVDPELVASDFCLLAGSYGEGFSYTGWVSKLHEAELVLSFLVGIFATVSDSEVEDDAALLTVLEELFETANVDLANGVNPYGSVSFFLV
jgi:hypothetical protein